LNQIDKIGDTIVAGNFELKDVGRFAWFLDPEGNRVELWQRFDRDPSHAAV